MPRSKRSTPAIGAAFGVVAGIAFLTALAVVELKSLMPSQYRWMGRPPFGWLSNAAVAYALAYYGLIGAALGAAAGGLVFWMLSLRGRLMAVKWGWLPVSIAGFIFLLLAGGKVLNVWIMPPRSQFGFYIWNGFYAAGCLIFSLVVGLLVRNASGLAAPRPRARIARLWRLGALMLAALGVYFGASVALVAWTGARAESGLGRIAEQSGSEPSPNVLLVIIETTRADHLSCYGYERTTTPNIDKWMAAQGALFENAVVQAPFSGPSKASIETGRYPHSHGVRDHPQRLPYSEITLAEQFKSHGYVTASIGAGEWEAPLYGYHQGFDLFNSIMVSYDRSRFWPFVRTFRLSFNKMAPWYTDPDERVKAVAAGRAADMAAGWMRSKHEEGRPFLMNLEFNEPHAVYEPPPPFDTVFGPTDEGKALGEEMKRASHGKGVYRYEYESLGKGPEVLDQAVALYDGEIAYVDYELGRLFDAMSSAGYLESTIVIVTADHGENFGEHGVYFCHTFLYDSSVKVPLLLRYPREVAPGTRVEAPVESIDIFPTLVELAGLPAEGLPLQGRSLMEPVRTGVGKQFIFTESRPYHPSFARYENYRLCVPGVEGKWTSVRSGDLKLIRIPTLAGIEWELYDLADDPGEKNNITGKNPMEGAMREALERWIAEGDAPEQTVTINDEETRQRLRSLGYID